MPRREKRTKMPDVTIIQNDDGLTVLGRIASFFSINSTNGNEDTIVTPSPRAARSLYKQIVKGAKRHRGNRIIHCGKPNRG